MLSQAGKGLMIAGLALALLGALIWLGGSLLGPNGLPGDVRVDRETGRGRFVFFFPLATCILLSVVLTILLNFFFRLKS